MSTASTTSRLADQAAQKADDAIRATQRVANEALDGLASSVESAHAGATPKLVRMAEQAESLYERGAGAVRDSAQQLRERAGRASEMTVGYIRDEPYKSVLIAAATGALLMGLLALFSRSRSP